MTALAGRKVLIVEDESLVAMLLETMLEDLGCTAVGPASNVDDGLALAREAAVDCALLDVNVAGTPVFPVAKALEDRGIPLIFSTGYGEGGLPDGWRGRITVQKPFTEAVIREALMRAMGVAQV